jgi:hypothetical protein
VIAFAQGGALETVQENVSGVLFRRQDVDGLLAAIHRSDKLQTPPEQIALLAARFSAQNFRTALTAVISQAMARRRPNA